MRRQSRSELPPEQATELLRELHEQLGRTCELDCPFSLTPPPVKPPTKRELRRLQPSFSS